MRDEYEIESPVAYGPGDPVTVSVSHREQAITVSDEGRAIERAGAPQGWRVAADRVASELDVNVSRHGVVSLPVVRVGPGEDAIVRRIAEASLALYQELLELSCDARARA
jgi:hypothetical protein